MRMLLVVALVTTPFIAIPPAAAAPTCDGRPATIVGEPGGTVTGTDGADVIVTHNAKRTDAGPGADLVCVTGRRKEPRVDLGAGDDRVLIMTPAAARIDTGDDAGIGHDEVVGSAGPDWVSTGVRSEPNDDDIQLGDGADNLDLRGFPTGTFDAGESDRRNSIALSTSDRHAWSVDEAAEEVRVDGVLTGITGTFDIYTTVRLPWTRFAFRGTSESEAVLLSEGQHGPKRGPIDLRMGGGADQVWISAFMRGSVDGGPGSDRLSIERLQPDGRLSGHLVVDLPRHRIRHDRQEPVRVVSFDAAYIHEFRSVEFVGTAASNVLVVDACRGVFRGGAGDDTMSMIRPQPCLGTHTTRVTSYGGPGDDRLEGAAGRDHLDGGPGHDNTDGRAGIDWCRAEETWRCERPS